LPSGAISSPENHSLFSSPEIIGSLKGRGTRGNKRAIKEPWEKEGGNGGEQKIFIWIGCLGLSDSISTTLKIEGRC